MCLAEINLRLARMGYAALAAMFKKYGNSE
jgi:hypothetical protein